MCSHKIWIRLNILFSASFLGILAWHHMSEPGTAAGAVLAASAGTHLLLHEVPMALMAFAGIIVSFCRR